MALLSLEIIQLLMCWRIMSGLLLYGLIVVVSIVLCLSIIQFIVIYVVFLHPLLGIQKR